MKLNTALAIIIVMFSCSPHTEITGKYAEKKGTYFFQLNPDSSFYYEFGSFHLFDYSAGSWSKGEGDYVILNSYNKLSELPVEVKNVVNSSKNNYSILTVNFNSDVGNDSDYYCRVIINDTDYNQLQNGCLIRAPNMDDFHKLIREEPNESKKSALDQWLTQMTQYIRCDSLIAVKVKTSIRSIRCVLIRSGRLTNRIAPNECTTEKKIIQGSGLMDLSMKVTIVDSLLYHKVFDNEEIKIRSKRIKFFASRKNKGRWTTISKVPDSLNLFSRYH